MVGKTYKALDCFASAEMQQHVEDLEDALVATLSCINPLTPEMYNLLKDNCAHIDSRLIADNKTVADVIVKALRGVKQ